MKCFGAECGKAITLSTFSGLKLISTSTVWRGEVHRHANTPPEALTDS
jgi:hypothetical protein